MLRQLCSLSTQGKHYTLMYLPVHGEQIEESPIFVASEVVSYDRLFKHVPTV